MSYPSSRWHSLWREALPSRWRKGAAGPLLARGGVECSLEWDADAGTLDVRLRCIRGVRRVDVVLPAGATVAGDSAGSLGGDRAGQLSVKLSETQLQLHATLKRT
jgi:alpha-L-fucosidase 2